MLLPALPIVQAKTAVVMVVAEFAGPVQMGPVPPEEFVKTPALLIVQAKTAVVMVVAELAGLAKLLKIAKQTEYVVLRQEGLAVMSASSVAPTRV